jgi:hypothetical protein
MNCSHLQWPTVLKDYVLCYATCQLWMVNHHLQLTSCITCCMCLQVLQLLEGGWCLWPKHGGPSKFCTVQLVVNKFVYTRSLHTRHITLKVKHFILKTMVCFGNRGFSCKQYFYCLVWNYNCVHTTRDRSHNQAYVYCISCLVKTLEAITHTL